MPRHFIFFSVKLQPGTIFSTDAIHVYIVMYVCIYVLTVQLLKFKRFTMFKAIADAAVYDIDNE